MFKQFIFILFLIVIFLFVPHLVFAHEITGATVIHIDENGFSPTDVTIEKGEKIIFENTGKKAHWPASNIHPTHTIYPEFDPKKGIKPGESWSFIFNKVGSWRMHDHLFPEFTGKVTVKPSAEASESLFTKIVTFFKGLFGIKSQEEEAKADTHQYNGNISPNDQTMATDEDALYSYVKKFGAYQATKHLAAVDQAKGIDCHQTAHKLGRFAYEINGEKTFGQCSGECHSGCYHGATEAYFREHGTEHLQTDLQVICGGNLNQFFSHQCLHGVGHGLMVWADYDIHEALKDCDLLSKGQDSCYSGVFMENIIGGVPVGDQKSANQVGDKHYTKYLNNDPQYPCTVVADKYKAGCYFYQSSRMAQLFHFDFAKITAACLAAPSEYQGLCIESMGRDVSGFTGQNPEKSIALCQNVPAGVLRGHCINGAVQDAFWDRSGQDTAIHFCTLLTDVSEKDTCYETINERMTQILTDAKEREQYCRKEEAKYVQGCRDIAGL